MLPLRLTHLIRKERRKYNVVHRQSGPHNSSEPLHRQSSRCTDPSRIPSSCHKQPCQFGWPSQSVKDVKLIREERRSRYMREVGGPVWDVVDPSGEMRSSTPGQLPRLRTSTLSKRRKGGSPNPLGSTMVRLYVCTARWANFQRLISRAERWKFM